MFSLRTKEQRLDLLDRYLGIKPRPGGDPNLGLTPEGAERFKEDIRRDAPAVIFFHVFSVCAILGGIYIMYRMYMQI